MGPDFAKKAYGQHIEVVKKVFAFLASNKNRVPNDYMKEQLKGIDKYSSSVDLYKKGTPFHVKGTIIYNSLIRSNKLERTYPIIKNNEKIKYVYLKEPNPTTDRVIAFINNLPSEFGLDKYID